MKLCGRCMTTPATTTIAGVPLCAHCGGGWGRFAGQRVGAPRVGAWFPDPYAMGQDAGRKAADAAPGVEDSVKSAAGAARSTAEEIGRTVRVVAIAGAVASVAILGLAFWRARQAAGEARTFAEQHPEIARAALLGA